MSERVDCDRCGGKVTVSYTARGTERVHAHKCPHGRPCGPRIDEVPGRACTACKQRTVEP
jgi:hypothetical protein